MIDQIELTTTAKYNDDAGQWIAEIKGYPVTGRGPSPEEAVMNASDGLQRFFEERMGARTRYITARHISVSLNVEIEIGIETTRGTTLTEFGLGTGREEQEGEE